MGTGRGWAFERRADVAARRDAQTRAQLAFHEDGICRDCGCSGRALTVLVYIEDPATAAWVVLDPSRLGKHAADERWRDVEGIAPVTYVVCEYCATFWFLGLSVLTGWVHTESPAVWRANAELLSRLQYLPERVSSERRRLERG